MDKTRSIALLIILFCAAVLVLSACQQTASNLTNRTINNLENEVGGAAERASQNAGGQSGGLVCGAPLATLVIPMLIFSTKAASRSLGRKKSRRQTHDNTEFQQEKNNDPF
ncbi:MAG: hypothetical protein ACK2T3_16190 [Candidatus Promineifilaceae bacterium]